MSRFSSKLARYWRGVRHGLRHFKFRYGMKLFSASDFAIRRTVYDFLILINVMDRTLGRSILLSATYEENVTRAILDQLKPDTHFLDIGANIGWFSLLVASRCPQGRVYSIEPDPGVFQLFSAAIALNGYNEIIEAHHLAASDAEGELIVTDLGNPTNYGARFTGRSQEDLAPFVHGPNPSATKVRAVAVDDLLPDAQVDLVKVDIEGFEPYAFQGMARLIERCHPVIISEFAPSNLENLGKTSPEAFLQFFVERGYRLNVIGPQGEAIPCGNDAARVMDYFHQNGGHHLDLLFLSEAAA